MSAQKPKEVTTQKDLESAQTSVLVSTPNKQTLFGFRFLTLVQFAASKTSDSFGKLITRRRLWRGFSKPQTNLTVPNRLSLFKQHPFLIKLALSGLCLLILMFGVKTMISRLVSVLTFAHRVKFMSVEAMTFPYQSTRYRIPTSIHSSPLNLTQEMIPLRSDVEQLVAKKPGLTLGAFFVDLDNGAYLDVNGTKPFAAASMIKFPILVAFFQDVEAGRIHFNDILTLTTRDIAKGNSSGNMKYKPPGTKFTALETATKMITISDNTATNMLIVRLGGAKVLNQRFRNWGLRATKIQNRLPDLSGTNTTTPLDLAKLMAMVDHENLVSNTSRRRLLNIMQQTTIRTLLPPGLGPGATIAHKTGDIGTLVGDVGLVTLPNGKRYIAVAMVRRSYNDRRAQELIRQISRATYQQFGGKVATLKYSALNGLKGRNYRITRRNCDRCHKVGSGE
jgi:beta-lactamase class A